jgi:acetyl-CoA carboxylase carboxyl transferase subunit beta
MSWLTNFVRPKLRALVRKTEVPDNLWDTCPACSKMIFHRDLEANQRVCPHCGHHMRLPAKRRLETLFDDGAYARIELLLPSSISSSRAVRWALRWAKASSRRPSLPSSSSRR